MWSDTISSQIYILISVHHQQSHSPQSRKIKLTQLRPDHLQKLYSEKLNSGLSMHTVLYIHQVLHKGIGQAVKWGLVSRNVTDLAEHPTNNRSAPETLSVAQVKQLLDYLKGDRLYPLYLLLSQQFVRVG